MGSCNPLHAFQDCRIAELRDRRNYDGLMPTFDNSQYGNHAVIPGISAYSSPSGG